MNDKILQWLVFSFFGGLLGMVGQGLRVVVGIKKMHDSAAQQGKTFSDLYDPGKIQLSLLIGFLAGFLAILVTGQDPAGFTPTRQWMLTIMGAGYAGTDFIEGLIKKYLPADADSASGQAPQPPNASPNPGQPAAPTAPSAAAQAAPSAAEPESAPAVG